MPKLSPTQLPSTRVAGLQRNFYIENMKEISKKFEKQIDNSCQQHGIRLSFFCETCRSVICPECALRYHDQSAGHVIKDVDEAQVIHRQALLLQLNKRQISLTQIQNNMEQIELEMALLTAAKETTEGEIRKCIQLACKKLEKRQEMLIGSNEQQFNVIKNTLCKQTTLQKANAILSNNLNQAKNLVKTGALNEVIAINQNLIDMAEEMPSEFADLDLGNNFISYDSKKGSEAFERSSCKLGEINIQGCLPAKVEFKSEAVVCTGQKCVTQVEVFSHNGEAVPVTASHFTAEVTDPEDTKIHCTLNTCGNECTVTFTPQMSGLHTVSLLFLGQLLINEQKQISIGSNNPVLKFGELGNGKGKFRRPSGIAIDNDNCLYVADTGNALIQKFTADGKFLSQFNINVNSKDNNTVDIAVDMNAGLLLCVVKSSTCPFSIQGGKRLLVFDLQGVLQRTHTLINVSNAAFISINKQGEIILSDQGNQRLCKVEQHGNFLSHMGNLKCPGYIAITEDDNIIVPDINSDCICILRPDGRLKHTFGSSGTKKG